MERESQVGDAGFEVVHEACDRAVVFAAVVGNDAGCERLSGSAQRWRSGVVTMSRE